MKVTLDIDDTTWKVLEPILAPLVVSPETEDRAIDFNEIYKLKNGTRIVNTLLSGYWRGYPNGKIITVGELKRISRTDFIRHRNVGKDSWEVLQEYIGTLIDNEKE